MGKCMFKAIKWFYRFFLNTFPYNHSSHLDFNDFMNLYKKFTAKPYSFLVIDAAIVSDNPSHFRKNLLKRK